MFSAVFFFSWGGLGGRSRSNHFKKFAKANFLKWCRGGVWGGLPPQESPLPVPCPPGGVWGASPPRNLRYPCLAPAAAVPCPRALPPIFFRPKIFPTAKFFDRKKFRPKNFSTENFFGRKIFGRKNFRSKSFSSEFFSSTPGPDHPIAGN